METDNPIDKERVFIICFYLSDDTIAVFEPTQRNSGGNFYLKQLHFDVLQCIVWSPYTDILKLEYSTDL